MACLFLASCGGPSPSPVNNTPIDVETYTSALRQDEKLIRGQIYADTLEFGTFEADGDYPLISMKKDGQDYVFLYEDSIGPRWNRGDIIEVRWKMDYMGPDDEYGTWPVKEWVVGTKKLKEGKVSHFRERYQKPLEYYYDSRFDFTPACLDKIYRLVEYYLASSEQELITANINDPSSVFVYSIEEQERDGRDYYLVGISNQFETVSSIIQWIYLSDDLQDIYEYNLPDDRLIKFGR